MKKRFLSIFLIIIFILSCFNFNVSADEIKGQLGFATTGTLLTSGDNTAICYLNTAPADDVLFVAAYYLADGTLSRAVSTTVTEKKLYRLTLSIPETVSFGDYAKVMAFNKRTMEPVKATTTISRELYCTKAIVQGAYTSYEGLNERYYTIESNGYGLTAKGNMLSVSSSPSPFRLKDMANGEYAFEDYTTPRYRITCSEENTLSLSNYISGSSGQRFTLSEYNNGYAIEFSENRYLALEGTSLVLSDNKYEWTLKLKGETPFTLMTGLDGFGEMTDSQRQRVIEICTSTGIRALPSMDTNGMSYLDTIESAFISIYTKSGDLSPDEEKTMILNAVSQPVMGALVNRPSLPVFPGNDAVITKSSPVKTTHVMWDLVEENGVIYSASTQHPYTGKPVTCYRINATYTTDTSSQTVSVYSIDPEFANVDNAIAALGKFPYEYRKQVKNMYVYAPSYSESYNLGYNSDYNGDELFVRLKFITAPDEMAKGFAHELGHSLDYHANSNPRSSTTHWSQGAKWSECIKNDIVTVSDYANSNLYENFAEFARLYWLCYSDRDLEIGIKQLYPETFASFQRALAKIGLKGEILY